MSKKPSYIQKQKIIPSILRDLDIKEIKTVSYGIFTESLEKKGYEIFDASMNFSEAIVREIKSNGEKIAKEMKAGKIPNPEICTQLSEIKGKMSNGKEVYIDINPECSGITLIGSEEKGDDSYIHKNIRKKVERVAKKYNFNYCVKE